MLFEEFQGGPKARLRPSWIAEGTILAILNVCLTVKLPIKFQLKPTKGVGADVF